MIDVTVPGEIEASAEAVWEIVSDFGNVPWMKGVSRTEVEGTGPGMVRLIFAGDGPPVREELEFLDGDEMRLGYTITENLPMPVTDYHAVMRVVDLGAGRSRLDWSCRAEPAGVPAEAAEKTVMGMYGVLISWVKAHAEG